MGERERTEGTSGVWACRYNIPFSAGTFMGPWVSLRVDGWGPPRTPPPSSAPRNQGSLLSLLWALCLSGWQADRTVMWHRAWSPGFLGILVHTQSGCGMGLVARDASRVPSASSAGDTGHRVTPGCGGGINSPPSWVGPVAGHPKESLLKPFSAPSGGQAVRLSCLCKLPLCTSLPPYSSITAVTLSPGCRWTLALACPWWGWGLSLLLGLIT